MHSLSSRSLSRTARPSWSALGRWTALAALASFGGVIGCSDDDDPNTSSLADSGSLTAVTGTDIEIPTTVTVSQGVVWVVESQFSRFPAFVGDDAPEPQPFRLIGYPLAEGEQLEYIGLPPNFFPEGITSAGDGRIYVGSVATGAIYTIGPDTFDAEVFIGSGAIGAASVFGMTVSRDQRMLWTCASNADGVWLAGIDIASASQVVRHTLEPAGDVPSFCNDVVQSPDGALWITESFGGRIFRVDPADMMTRDSANVWLEAENLWGVDGPAANIFGANGLTLLGSRLFIVNSSRGSLWRIDPSIAEPSEEDLDLVTLSEGDDDNVALNGPDGVFGLPNGRQLLIVENGFNLGGAGKRVVMATLGN